MHSIKAREDGTFMDMVFDEKFAPTMFIPTKYVSFYVTDIRHSH